MGQAFGYVEFIIDDTTRWGAQGRTLSVLETDNEGVQEHGFLGRNVLWAPLGYVETRRIPLNVGRHTLEISGKKLDVDVVASKVAPFTVRIDQAGITFQAGGLRDP
jgi:hypothetical protein